MSTLRTRPVGALPNMDTKKRATIRSQVAWSLVAVVFASTHGSWADELAGPSDILLDGFRRYHSVCSHCHGPDGLGSSFAPGLLDQSFDGASFRAVVRDGTRSDLGVMKGFGENPDVMAAVDAIAAYIEARSAGVLGRGRPTESPPQGN